MSRICGWIDGSPPENWTASGSPSAATNASSIASTCASASENPSGWCPVPESAKQTGQSRLHAVLTSMIPRQVCWACSGQIPQSLRAAVVDSGLAHERRRSWLVEALDVAVAHGVAVDDRLERP